MASNSSQLRTLTWTCGSSYSSRVVAVMFHLAAVITIACGASTGFRPASTFGSNMVLQATGAVADQGTTSTAYRPPDAAVFGGASTSDTTITLTLTKAGGKPMVYTTTSSTTSGFPWKIMITPTPPASTDTYKVSLRESGVGASTQVFTANGVVFGTVFICSGQSNMEFPVREIDTASAVIADADKRSNIRLFSAPDDPLYPEEYAHHNLAMFYPDTYNVSWVTASSATVPTFSAICWMAATHIMDTHTAANPIGLIQSAKGGTPVEGWGTQAVFDTCQIASSLPIPTQDGAMNQSTSKVNVTKEYWAHPGTLYNQMIGPLLGTSVTAVLWYQGEANMNEGFHLSRHNYFCLFSQMIRAWRSDFGQPALPFNFVQLHACDDGNTGQCFADFCNYGDIRMAQDDTTRYTDGVGMAVSFDHGHVGIHSPHKAEVARRLGLKILSTAFAMTVPEDGPIVTGACVLTPPSVQGGSNKTAVKVLLANVKQMFFEPTDECSVQSPICCNGTTPGLPGTAYGIAQIAVGDVWKGQQWYDATMVQGPDNSSLIFTADLGDNTHTWGQENAPVWQIRFTFGAFPSCAVTNENRIPLAPFGPLAVSPACSFEEYHTRMAAVTAY